MTHTDYFNIAAILLAPILSVIIGQFLQDQAKKREDKMALFKAIMASRVYGWTTESVYALNIVEIVFANNRDVVNQWRAYYDKLCVQATDDSTLKKIENELTKLLLEMAKVLGYKDKVTWETIQNPYIPTGMANRIQLQNESMADYAALLKKVRQGFIMNQSQEESTHGQAEDAHT